MKRSQYYHLAIFCLMEELRFLRQSWSSTSGCKQVLLIFGSVTKSWQSCSTNWLRVWLEIFWMCYWRNIDKRFMRKGTINRIKKEEKTDLKMVVYSSISDYQWSTGQWYQAIYFFEDPSGIDGFCLSRSWFTLLVTYKQHFPLRKRKTIFLSCE